MISTLRRYAGNVGRWSAAHPAALLWVAFVLACAVLATVFPVLANALYLVELGAVGAIWIAVVLMSRRYSRQATERLRADLEEERAQNGRLRDAVHEHYLDAIRDREMPAAAYGRVQRLAELCRHIQFPDIYPEPEVEHGPSEAQFDREVKAATFAGYGPDGEIER